MFAPRSTRHLVRLGISPSLSASGQSNGIDTSPRGCDPPLWPGIWQRLYDMSARAPPPPSCFRWTAPTWRYPIIPQRRVSWQRSMKLATGEYHQDSPSQGHGLIGGCSKWEATRIPARRWGTLGPTATIVPATS